MMLICCPIDAAIVDVLRALGAPTDGNAAQRKSRLRLQRGLTEERI